MALDAVPGHDKRLPVQCPDRQLPRHADRHARRRRCSVSGRFRRSTPLAPLCWFVTQLFRNSPWLVLLFIVMLAFPFEIVIGDDIISIPDWIKAVFGLSLPIMANISEIVRGAVQSVPTGSGKPPNRWPSAAGRRCGGSSCRSVSSA